MIYYCPHCGEKMDMPVRPNFCVACGSSTVPGKTTQRPQENQQHEPQVAEKIPDIRKFDFTFDAVEGRAFTADDITNGRVQRGEFGKRVGKSKEQNLREVEDRLKSRGTPEEISE